MSSDASSQAQFDTDDQDADRQQCAAIAVSTSERCERDAVAGTSYCPWHLSDLTFDDQ